MMKSRFVWEPDEQAVQGSRLRVFLDDHGLADYADLGRRAIEDPEWFHEALIRFFGLRFLAPWERAPGCVTGKAMAGLVYRGPPPTFPRIASIATWKKGRAAGSPSSGRVRTARSVNGHIQNWREETSRLAAGLRRLGLKKGDVIAIYMPMVPEVAATFMAIARIGAVALPLFSGFGPAAISSRLKDAAAKGHRNGRWHPQKRLRRRNEGAGGPGHPGCRDLAACYRA